jgi:hypothetical protein
MISISYTKITSAVKQASFLARQQAAGIFARRALRNFAAAVPWQQVGTDAAVREGLWSEVEKLCDRAGRRFGVPGDEVQTACPEAALLKVLMTEQLKPQPILMPMTFIAVSKD